MITTTAFWVAYVTVLVLITLSHWLIVRAHNEAVRSINANNDQLVRVISFLAEKLGYKIVPEDDENKE